MWTGFLFQLIRKLHTPRSNWGLNAALCFVLPRTLHIVLMMCLNIPAPNGSPGKNGEYVLANGFP